MAWGDKTEIKRKDKVSVVTRETFFKKSKAFVHDQGLKILVWGGPEVGKTFFALSCPGPIYVIDTEFGTSPVTRHFEGKAIFIHEAAILDESTDEPDVDASLKSLEQAIATLKDIETGTIVIDSGTDIWQWLGAWVEQQARKSGRMTSAGTPQRLEWGRANLRWRQLILRLMAKPVHFVITAQVAEKYTGKGEATGDYVPKVQKQTAHMCDVIMHLEKKYIPTGELNAKKQPILKQGYVGTMQKCRFQRGLEMQIEDVTYDKLVERFKSDLGVEIINPKTKVENLKEHEIEQTEVEV